MTWLKREIPNHLAVLSGPHPPDENCFKSDSLQILCNSSDSPWVDDGLHAHLESDEVYLVLEGMIELAIEDETVIIAAGEICFVPRGAFHAVTNVHVPYRGFVIRAPSVADKIYPPET